MRLDQLAKANREALRLLLKTWCLLIDTRTKLLSREKVGYELFTGTSEARQWYRWKVEGQLPPIDELVGATAAAISKGWIDSDISKLIVDAYTQRRSVAPSEDVYSDADLMNVADAINEYPGKSKELVEHYEELCWYAYGPDEDDPSYEEWISHRELINHMINEDNIDERIEIELNCLIESLVRFKVSDPYERIRGALKSLENRVENDY